MVTYKLNHCRSVFDTLSSCSLQYSPLCLSHQLPRLESPKFRPSKASTRLCESMLRYFPIWFGTRDQGRTLRSFQRYAPYVWVSKYAAYSALHARCLSRRPNSMNKNFKTLFQVYAVVDISLQFSKWNQTILLFVRPRAVDQNREIFDRTNLF